MLKLLTGEVFTEQMPYLAETPLKSPLPRAIYEKGRRGGALHGSLLLFDPTMPVYWVLDRTNELLQWALAHPECELTVHTNNADVLSTIACCPDVRKIVESITLNREDSTALTLSGEEFARAYRVGAVDIRRL